MQKDTELVKITPARAGEIALTIINEIYGRRGLDLRRNNFNEWCKDKARQMEWDGNTFFEFFAKEIIVRTVASRHFAVPEIDYTAFAENTKSNFEEFALRMLCVEDVNMGDLTKIIDEYTSKGFASRQELVSLVNHYWWQHHADKLTRSVEKPPTVVIKTTH